MAYLNKVMLMGNLGKDAEVRMTPSGKKKVSFSLATTQRYKDSASGEMRDKTDWHNIVAWNRAADRLEQMNLRKGTPLYVEGRISYRSWDDPQSGQKRYMTEIELDEFQFLAPRNAGGEAPAGGYRTAPAANSGFGGAPSYSNNQSGYQNAAPDYDAPSAASGADDDLPF